MNIYKRNIISGDGKWDLFSAVLFGLVFCDSLITYFGSRFGGIRPAIITLILFLIFVSLRKFDHVLPRKSVLIWMGVMIAGFLIGVVTAHDVGFERIPQLVSACVAFFVGFTFFKYTANEKNVYTFFLILSALYIIVCLLAVLKIAPQYFPIEVSLWADGYSLHERPAITTDQNFQFFYLFLPVLLIMLPLGWLRLCIVICLLLGAAFVLVRLQTRSGTLVLMGGAIIAMAYPFFSKSFDRKKILILITIGFLVVLALLPKILNELDPLLTRFLSEGKEQSTSSVRVASALYIFDVVWNPFYWIPQGNPTSILGAHKPHSNIAAVFLEAGILGLIGWVMLFVRPTFQLAKEYYSKNSDRIVSMVFVSSVMVLILQMSLNVPVMDQVWLWAGAVNGALEKLRQNKNSLNRVDKSETKKIDNVAVKSRGTGVTLR